MRRRLLIAGLATAWSPPMHVRAQQAPAIPLVGFLHPGFAEAGNPVFQSLTEGLREFGYIDGKNVRIDARWGMGKADALFGPARELVQLRAAVLVATARPSIEAARAATSELPIIANDLESDPVASGYVANLAHPGGNLTGFFLDSPSLCGKWLQQIGQIVPNLKKIAALWDSTTGRYQHDAMRAAAAQSSIELSILEFRDDAQLDKTLQAGLDQGPQAVIVLGSPLTRQGGARIAGILAARGVPGISQFRSFPDGGGLISYGPNLPDLYRRLGIYVSKVLRGARPGDLPIERPSKFELVVNLKSARALQLKVPPVLLTAADDVIE